MPKPSWPLQPWARPCPETALSPAAGAPSPALGPGVPQPWGTPATAPALPGGGMGSRLHGGSGLPYAGPAGVPGSPALPMTSSSGARLGSLPQQQWCRAPRHPQGQYLPVPACQSLPLPEFGEKGGGGNRTGSMAVAMPVSVIYIVYKSIKQSVLLSAILPGGLVLLQERTAGGWQGVRGGEGRQPPPNRQPSTNQDPF